MSLEVSKQEKKQKALENLKKGRELRAKNLAEKKKEKESVVDELSELDELPKPPKTPKAKPKKVVDPIIEPPKIEFPKNDPVVSNPPEPQIVKPKKQYKPREPKPPLIVEKVVEKIVYAPPPMEIQFY